MKSQNQILAKLARLVFLDLQCQCAARALTDRDWTTIQSRIEHEGVSFLTITLPAFCSDVMFCLEKGRIDPSCFRSFRKRGAIPAFLSGMLGQMFDVNNGNLQRFEPELLGYLRQLTLAFKKIQLDCTEKRKIAAVQRFKLVDAELPVLSTERREYLRKLGSLVWSDFFRRNPIDTDLFIPKHGPGVTSDKKCGNNKFQHSYWYERLEPYFPGWKYAFGSMNAISDGVYEGLNYLTEDKELPTKMFLVPKTMKTPRVIAAEPALVQWCQQAVKAYLTNALENDPASGGHVNFSSQAINQDLAMTSSGSGEYATLDLTDASDRVSLELVRAIFGDFPEFLDVIESCRTRFVELPDGTIYGPLKKFASMGSALCFPVESMVFYTLCVGALLEAEGLPFISRYYKLVSRCVYVYGDDLIIPSRCAALVVDYLHQNGCKVNVAKSFWTGRFRESCGEDWYDGHRVTPVYIRSVPLMTKRDVTIIASTVACARHFDNIGMLSTAQFLYNQVQEVLGSLPVTSDQSSLLGVSDRGTVQFLTRNKCKKRKMSRSHTLVTYGWSLKSRLHRDPIADYAALTKALTSLELSQKTRFKTCLELDRVTRRGDVALIPRWASTR